MRKMLQIDDALYAALEAQAQQERRTTTQHMLYILEQAVQQSGIPGILPRTSQSGRARQGSRVVATDASLLQVLPEYIRDFFAHEIIENLQTSEALIAYESYETDTEFYLVFDDFVAYVRERQPMPAGQARAAVTRCLNALGWSVCRVALSPDICAHTDATERLYYRKEKTA